MSSNKALYLTTTLPYVNAEPHIGFAHEIVLADILARWRALNGDEVFFNTGTDEHGLKIYRKAREGGKTPQAYVDEYAAKFRGLKDKLNLFPDIHFIRTTDPAHIKAAQEFWQRCLKAGDIYKKNYQIKYCVGCELEKTSSELVNDCCPLHPTTPIELIDEENYFFRFSKYQDALLALYKRNPEFVLPPSRLNEIQAFVERGLEDFSISRLKEKMPWGIPVPGDDTQVMYVWFDALINYVSTLGWPHDGASFERFWGTEAAPQALQVAGKDNLRQQSAMWQSMLLSAGLPTSKQVLIFGFVTSGGRKMSKSLGNVVNPYAIVDEYGADALRYFLARHMTPFEDSDFTDERFKDVYNADLANGLGNLTARVMQLAEKNLPGPVVLPGMEFPDNYTDALKKYEFNRALDIVFERVAALDQAITQSEPFKVVKSDPERGRGIITAMAQELYVIGMLLEPFMPGTSSKIRAAVVANKKPETLFPRK